MGFWSLDHSLLPRLATRSVCKPVAPSVHPFSPTRVQDPGRHYDSPVTNKRIHPMIARAETPQLHLLPVLNLLRVAVPPFHRHLRVRVRVDQDVKGAVAGIELGQECHGRGDLAEDGLDLELDFLLRLLRGRFGGVSALEVRGVAGERCGKGVLASAPRSPCQAASMCPWKPPSSKAG